MTESLERHLSAAALEASTPEGARELAAAEVMVRASTLMWKAFEQSGLTQRELAEALGVTEGRVSQILHGDGNVRLSTLARYLRATGYLTKLDAVPADASTAPLRTRANRRHNRREAADLHDLFVTGITHNGQQNIKIVAVPSGVPHDALETSMTRYVGTSAVALGWQPQSGREVGA